MYFNEIFIFMDFFMDFNKSFLNEHETSLHFNKEYGLMHVEYIVLSICILMKFLYL
jgi:hypothetical protein